MEWIDDLPSQVELKDIQNPIASELYTRDEKLIGKYFLENRSDLRFEDLNDHFKHALVATEDRRFYDHHGVDTKSLFRVFFKSILFQQDGSGGGSTITQQLVKNLFPRKRYSIFSTLCNKYREMAIAKRLEKIYTKDDILLLYANTVSFGEQAFGLATAAKRFFNKQPNELLIEEAATLVGILKATSYYSPRNYPDRAKSRRNIVLQQMVNNKYLKQDVNDQLKNLPLVLNYQSPSDRIELARYFKQQVKKDFQKWSLGVSKADGSKYNIKKDGLKIISTLDYDMQIAAERIMQSHMSKLQELFLKSWESGSLFGKNSKIIDDGIFADPEYINLRESGLTNKESIAKLAEHKIRKFWSWDGYKTESKTRIDSIKHYLSLLHAGILVAEPKSGAIKTWVGGNDFGEFQWDNVTAPRQVGSTFKPIVYLTALEKGIDPCQYFENELRSYSDYDDWTPRNANAVYGGYASVKGALTHSINTVSVQLLFEAGIPNVVNLAKDLGIQSPLAEVPSLVLGTSDISLFDMVTAYSTLANDGRKIALHSIKKIIDRNGEILFENRLSSDTLGAVQSVSMENIKQLNIMMQHVTLEGTGQRLYRNFDIDFPISGKTGTTQNQSDGWFIGYTKDLVIGAWVGAQDRRIHFRNLRTGSGGRTALPLVGALFEYANNAGMIRPISFDEEQQFSCADTISEIEYARLQRRQSYDDDIAGNIFDLIFNRQKIQKRRNKRSTRNKDKQRRIREYENAIKEWERKLKALRKELEKDF